MRGCRRLRRSKAILPNCSKRLAVCSGESPMRAFEISFSALTSIARCRARKRPGNSPSATSGRLIQRIDRPPRRNSFSPAVPFCRFGKEIWRRCSEMFGSFLHPDAICFRIGAFCSLGHVVDALVHQTCGQSAHRRLTGSSFSALFNAGRASSPAAQASCTRWRAAYSPPRPAPGSFL